MKYIIAGLLIMIAAGAFAQTDISVGAGYFGHVLSHPGVSVEFDVAAGNPESAQVFSRTDVNVYSHPRNHTGLLVQTGFGLRRGFQSGLYLEEGIEFGMLASALNSDAVYTIDEDGAVVETSRLNPIDLTATIAVGIGYTFLRNSDSPLRVWLRPEIVWQFPHKRTSTFTPVLQIGLSRTLSILDE